MTAYASGPVHYGSLVSDPVFTIFLVLTSIPIQIGSNMEHIDNQPEQKSGPLKFSPIRTPDMMALVPSNFKRDARGGECCGIGSGALAGKTKKAARLSGFPCGGDRT